MKIKNLWDLELNIHMEYIISGGKTRMGLVTTSTDVYIAEAHWIHIPYTTELYECKSKDGTIGTIIQVL